MPKVKPRYNDMQHFESTEKIIEGASVGDEVTLTVKGTIKSLEERERVDWDLVDNKKKSEKEATKVFYEMGVEVDSIEYEYPNEFSKLAED